jgi:hypothetical protein
MRAQDLDEFEGGSESGVARRVWGADVTLRHVLNDKLAALRASDQQLLTIAFTTLDAEGGGDKTREQLILSLILYIHHSLVLVLLPAGSREVGLSRPSS